MIVYLDSSAVVKRYITEAGSQAVDQLYAQATQIGTGTLTRAEVAAALSKAARVGLLPRPAAQQALQTFRADWSHYLRLPIDELAVTQADHHAWEQGLRGYDAVHLAVALIWQNALQWPVTLATFDRQLWQAAPQVGLAVWPATWP